MFPFILSDQVLRLVERGSAAHTVNLRRERDGRNPRDRTERNPLYHHRVDPFGLCWNAVEDGPSFAQQSGMRTSIESAYVSAFIDQRWKASDDRVRSPAVPFRSRHTN